MNNDGNKILDAIKRMAADDNKGLRMTTTIVDVKDDPRGSIVGFGTEKVCGDDAKAQTLGLPSKYMACAFFIDREELKNTSNNKDMSEIKLSIRQIEMMQYAIGFDRRNIKKNKYEAYRNRYIVSKPDNDWEELVSFGYATKREFKIEKQIGYYVSEMGMKYLGVLFGCIIKETD